MFQQTSTVKLYQLMLLTCFHQNLGAEAVLNIGKALKPQGKALIQTWSESAAKAG